MRYNVKMRTTITHKICPKCQKDLPIDAFYPKGKHLDAHCRECRKSYSREYAKKNRDKVIANKRRYYQDVAKQRQIENRDEFNRRRKERTRKYKEQFIEMYGGKCNCCGETIFDFLTIEHRNGQKGKPKYEKSREHGEHGYKKASQEYRPDLYEILCWNCNCAKGHLGYCPHQNNQSFLPKTPA